ncbi:MAG: hypothetical protein LQ337_008274 [Flavoplaca oasis]|nr:MAG: hypothetical protein LQ337_008274 [Flavoplaca oasis]
MPRLRGMQNILSDPEIKPLPMAPFAQSLLDFFKIKLKEKDIPTALAERVLELCQSWGDYVGGDVDRQSLKYLWLEETIDGGYPKPNHQ